MMSVRQFTIPGHSTRREFAVYVAVARKSGTAEFLVYVGKTGDNREGCNPVISRAGNHFSYNKIHSQIRNKLDAAPHLFDYEYFYITIDTYSDGDAQRKSKVDVVNEMERATNRELTRRLSPNFQTCLLNEYKGAGYIRTEEREARRVLMSPERKQMVLTLVDSVMTYLASFNPALVHAADLVTTTPAGDP